MKKLIVFVVVLGIAGYFGGIALVGSRVEPQLHNLVKEFNGRGFPVQLEVKGFTKGYLTSHARLWLSAEGRPQLYLDSDIDNGPFSATARVHILPGSPLLHSPNSAPLKDLAQKLKMRVRVNLFKTLTLVGKLPAYTVKDNGTLNLSDVKAVLKLSGDFTSGGWRFRIGQAGLAADGVTMELHRLALHSHFKNAQKLPVGTTRITLDSFKGSFPAAAHRRELALAGLSLKGHSELDGDAMASETHFNLDKLTLQGKNPQQIDLALKIYNLNQQALLKLKALADKLPAAIRRGDTQAGQRFERAYMNALVEVLSHQPGIRLTQVRLKNDKGAVTVRGQLKVDGIKTPQDLRTLSRHLTITANLAAAPGALVEAMSSVSHFAAGRVPGADRDYDRMVESRMENLERMWVQAGIFKKKGDRYTCRYRFENGRTTINDKPM